MFSSYQAITTSYGAALEGFATMSGHDIVNALCRQADRLAPRFSDETADAGCTNYRPGADQPRCQKVWDLQAEALSWNMLADDAAMVAEAKSHEALGNAYTVSVRYSWEPNPGTYITSSNYDRVKRARNALTSSYSSASTGNQEDLTDAVTDLLTDLMHLAAHEGLDFPTAYQRAAGHYAHEAVKPGPAKWVDHSMHSMTPSSYTDDLAEARRDAREDDRDEAREWGGID